MYLCVAYFNGVIDRKFGRTQDIRKPIRDSTAGRASDSRESTHT